MNPLAVKAYGLLLSAALAAAGLPVGPGGLAPRAVVSYGHQGDVRDIAADSRRGLVFSVGEDGTLRVWDAGSQTLLRRIAITRQIAASISIDPAASLAAVLVTDGARAFSVDVWNWDTEELLYRVPLEAAPLFVRFSLTGTFLLVGEMTWDSLRVYRALDGQRVDSMDEGGMVGFAEVSRSDATLMTYRLSGRIAYEELSSGKSLKEVPTVPDLVGVRASADRRWLAGHTASEIFCIDALSGEVRVRLPAAAVVSLDVSDRADRIDWITADGDLHSWSASGESLSSESPAASSQAGSLGWKPLALTLAGDELLVGGAQGHMVKVSATGKRTELATDTLAKTSGLAASGTMLAVAAGSVIHVFQVTPRLMERFSMPSPFGERPVGLRALDDQRILAWPRNSGVGALGVINCTARSFTPLDVDFRGSLAAVNYRDGRVYALESSGRILVVDLATARTVFEASRPGAVCIAPVGDSSIVVGRTRSGALQSSLIRIDVNTGETSPIPGAETFTYALAASPIDGSLYSLGVDSDGKTKLFRHNGPDLAIESVVDSADGDLAASLSFDPSSGILYSSLGRQRVTAWFDGTLRTIGDPSPGIETFRVRNGLIAAIQRDATVSLWDAVKDQPLGTLYPFSDGSWAAIFADGSVQAAPAGMAKIGFFAQGELQETKAAPPSQEPPGVP